MLETYLYSKIKIKQIYTLFFYLWLKTKTHDCKTLSSDRMTNDECKKEVVLTTIYFK